MYCIIIYIDCLITDHGSIASAEQCTLAGGRWYSHPPKAISTYRFHPQMPMASFSVGYLKTHYTGRLIDQEIFGIRMGKSVDPKPILLR